MSVSAMHPSATVRNIAARTSSNGDITRVTIFDVENKFIAYTDTFEEGVRNIFCQWEQVFVLTTDGKLFSLQEKPTSAELEILFGRSFYVVAINVAKTRNLDAASVADVHKRYGDHLYSKGDYDSAMQQFIQTIGHLQPSYVIRKVKRAHTYIILTGNNDIFLKFLDAQRIHNLTTYLQELHSLGLANSDHTTLLLNTYTKLKDVSRLDSFIKTESHRTVSGDPNDLPFDLQTAIRVCRQAGYFEHASYLAKKYERHEDYLRIQVEDTENYADALDYVQKLGLEAAQNILIRYGRALLEHLPDETTTLLINICLGTSEVENSSVAMPIAKTATGPSYLSYLALGRNNVATNGDHPSPVSAIKDSSSLKGHAVPNRESSMGFRDGSRTSSPQPSITNIRPPIKLPSPRLYFSHFVDHIAHFVRFLETIALKRWGQSVDSTTTTKNIDILNELYEDQIEQAAVWNTLLELYLTLFSESPTPGENKLLEEKVVKLLQNQILPYDHTHALIVCSTRRFTPGLVFLWEKMGMYEDILRFWMEQEKEKSDPEASFQVLHHLKLYGPSHPYLYPLVLRFLTSDERLLSQHVADLIEILDHIQNKGIMPPLGVIQVLSRNGVTTVGLVKQWLMLRIRESQEEAQADRSLIESYRSETKAKLQEISELTDTQNPRAFQATRCTACGSPLDLPAIHFMCKHSYHQRCLSEQEAECPECARSHGVIREIRRNNERLVDQHEIFLGDVAERGFSAVAVGFGKGFMDSLLTLTYVDIRGLAEPINLLLVDANINYRNERLILSQWKTREAEGTYGPVYGQPFHDLPTLSVKTSLGTVNLAGIFTILEYLEDALDTHAGKDVLYKGIKNSSIIVIIKVTHILILWKAKVNMIRDASMSFLQECHNYLGSETWDSSEERQRFRQQRITPFLLDLSRHIGVNGLQGDFGADSRRPLTAAGACAFEALDLTETFYPAILNDWPVLAILRGRISIRPNIQSYLNGGKREPKISMSPYETPERVAYLSLKDVRSQPPAGGPRKSESGAPSIYSTTSESMGMGSSPRSSSHVLKKRHYPSISSMNKGSRGPRQSEDDRAITTTTSLKKDGLFSSSSSSKRSDDHSLEVEKRPRSHSFTSLFVRKKSSKSNISQPNSTQTSPRSTDSRANGDDRNRQSLQRGYYNRDSAPSIEHTIPDPTFSVTIPKSRFPMDNANNTVRSSVHSGSIYSTSSGPEYSIMAQAI
ncbi:hypothetical protein Clacol_006301 [Clathrus columnatus]|uniref:Vacuolar protein sorting-associated protein 11 homolog n=1 Tax=Clathrus columnatus TaxID=1419009 RepID=A0AAV5ACI7_9AGAM|nr:hypothetical protein Clacol_006301 [Clathrus columnatus]